VPVFASRRLAAFLRINEPWAALERERHIVLHELEVGTERRLNGRRTVTPMLVPHRDEHTDTLAFKIRGPDRSVLYLPDIDAWEQWSTTLADVLTTVDVAYLDGTFFDANELPGRDPTLVPHPTVLHTLEALAQLPAQERAKVRFVHLNHSNPAMDPSSPERLLIHAAGCRVAEELERTLL
jgi:pyrroloquinoline quinone biosynthesis protein B